MIEVKGISKAFNGNIILEDINLMVKTGKTLVVLGPSGIGKTVLLKIIVGLLNPDDGDILYNGNSILKMKPKQLANLRSRIGFVFQSSALFDSMTVYENVALRLIQNQDINIAENVESILKEFNIYSARDRYPAEISGGMKKLVALARAMVTEPDYLFYDEPTSGLDPAMRIHIIDEMTRLQEKANPTSTVVTHDLDVAFEVGSQTLMLKQGNVFEVKSKREAKGYYEK